MRFRRRKDAASRSGPAGLFAAPANTGIFK